MCIMEGVADPLIRPCRSRSSYLTTPQLHDYDYDYVPHPIGARWHKLNNITAQIYCSRDNLTIRIHVWMFSQYRTLCNKDPLSYHVQLLESLYVFKYLAVSVGPG